jgi:MFS family permease
MGLAVSERLHLKGTYAYPGWTIVLVAFVCMALVFASSTAAMPLLYGPIIEEFGWSRTQATLMFTYKNIASAVAALFFVGPLCGRFGLRRVTIGAFVTTGLAMVSFLWVNSIWSYYAAGVALGIGVATAFIAAKVLVSRWFIRNQGLALGVTLAGTSVGGMIAPLLYVMLDENVGWRLAFAALSLGIWCIALPLYLAKAKEDPSEEDLLLETRTDLAMARGADDGVPDESFRALLLTPMFWLIAVSLFLIAGADAGLMQHTILFLEHDAGLSTSIAAAALSGALGLGVIAKIGAGWVYDRYSLRGISIWYVLLGISVALVFSVSGVLTLALFACVRGIAHGGLMLGPAVIAKHCYGPRLMHMTVSVFMGVWALGAALGPVIPALFYDMQGTYKNGFALLIGLCFIAALALTRVRSSYRDRLGLSPANGRSQSSRVSLYGG